MEKFINEIQIKNAGKKIHKTGKEDT